MTSDLTNWQWRQPPDFKRANGRYVCIERATFPEDGEKIFSAVGGPGNDALWTYIPIGPFDTASDLNGVMAYLIEKDRWQTHLLSSPEGKPLGMASYMRIRPEAGSAEVGCIVFSKDLQRTPAATEAMYLMARHVFDDLGYRRYEWKCNNANEASKRAAVRLGFQFEGVFRNDMVMKGKNRDTAWFSIIDSEWPEVKRAFEAWLAPENFDDQGRQKKSLVELRKSASA